MTDEDRPITLNDACSIFRGSLTPSTLRAEADRGNLTIFKIGRRYYTTPAFVESMVRKCQESQQARGSISTRNGEHGPSEMDQKRSAQAALKATVLELRKPSKVI